MGLVLKIVGPVSNLILIFNNGRKEYMNITLILYIIEIKSTASKNLKRKYHEVVLVLYNYNNKALIIIMNMLS